MGFYFLAHHLSRFLRCLDLEIGKVESSKLPHHRKPSLHMAANDGLHCNPVHFHSRVSFAWVVSRRLVAEKCCRTAWDGPVSTLQRCELPCKRHEQPGDCLAHFLCDRRFGLHFPFGQWYLDRRNHLGSLVDTEITTPSEYRLCYIRRFYRNGGTQLAGCREDHRR